MPNLVSCVQWHTTVIRSHWPTVLHINVTGIGKPHLAIQYMIFGIIMLQCLFFVLVLPQSLLIKPILVDFLLQELSEQHQLHPVNDTSPQEIGSASWKKSSYWQLVSAARLLWLDQSGKVLVLLSGECKQPRDYNQQVAREWGRREESGSGLAG